MAKIIHFKGVKRKKRRDITVRVALSCTALSLTWVNDMGHISFMAETPLNDIMLFQKKG